MSTTMKLTRRSLLTGCLGTLGAIPLEFTRPSAAHSAAASSSTYLFPWEQVRNQLGRRFHDLRRHFVFEYYPWYANEPFRHWQQWDRRPPTDIAANTVPWLGPYDSRAVKVLEQHARWIADSGVGTINISWWGQESFSDRAVPLLMDVMGDHDIRVTFHLEPYARDRVTRFPSDVIYLLKEFGEKRRWDHFFFDERDDRSKGPVFKTFSTILPSQIEDCHGVWQKPPDYVPDTEWRRATDRLRNTLRTDFDRITLLADSVEARRVRAAGFDGMAPYGPFVKRADWLSYALAASRLGLVFSFNVNPGFDEIVRRNVEPASCYTRRPFIPRTRDLAWTKPEDRELAKQLGERQTKETLQWSLLLQTHPWLGNVSQGFFLVYICSFNEWHEGTQFEPMKNFSALTQDERAHEYHNPSDGFYRLRHLADLVGRLL